MCCVRVLVWIPPGAPPHPFSTVWGHVGVRLLVPPKVIQESSRCEPFTGLGCGAGRRSVTTPRLELTTQRAGGREGGHCSANGTSTPSYTVLVAQSHKRAQEDANQDEWHFFSSSPHHHHPLCSFYTNQRFSFAVAQRQPLHRQPPIRAR